MREIQAILFRYPAGLCTAFLLLSFTVAHGQHMIKGSVTDAGTKMPLPDAIIRIKNSSAGTATDKTGQFEIQVPVLPATIIVSSVGFISKELVVDTTAPVAVRLKADARTLQSVSVYGSRLTDRQKQEPLTVESIDRIGLRQIATADFYEGLGQLKGVDVTSASFGFKVVNTRGFNSTSPVRSLQLIDGVDNQAPGLNMSLGNFLGSSEADVQKIELIEGAGSAFYGPNAFNGVINITTRSPFTSKGIEVRAKMGEHDLFEGAIRIANFIKNKKGEPKLGYKVNVFGMKATDWTTNNLSATPQSKSGVGNPGGWDAVNVYGDEYIYGTDYTKASGSFPGLGVFYRKGYVESDLVDRRIWNVKANAGIYYRITPSVELQYTSSFCTGSTIYQGDNRYMLKNILFYQNKLEIKNNDRWFVRVYATNENSGQSYDPYFTALQLQAKAKSTSLWKQDYENYWNSHYNLTYVSKLPGFQQAPGPGPAFVQWLAQVNPFLLTHYRDSLIAWQNAAQTYANGVGLTGNTNAVPFFEPGTKRFDTAFAAITGRRLSQGGTQFYDRSALYHIQGGYKLKPAFCDVSVGGNYRLYAPKTDGTIMSDTNGRVIHNSEMGFYVGFEKSVWHKRLKIDVTERVDKNQNFQWLSSEAISAVFKVVDDHFARVLFSSAIRNPTLSDQYLYYNVGPAILAGNLNGFTGLVTIPSLIKSFDYNQSFDTLSYFNVKPVRPEQVKTIEAGYRATLASHLYADINAYYSWYKYFIGYKVGATVDTTTIKTIYGNYHRITPGQVYRVATNSEDEVTTSGVTVGLDYYFLDHFSLSANYSWNALDRHGSVDPLIPSYNTPQNKFNINFGGRDFHSYSFSVNYKLVQGFEFQGSPQFTGYINSYDVLDVQVSRSIPRLYSIVKIGAGNILNNTHYEVYGGPQVGRLAYISLLVNVANQ
jgi:iron complex outermembrane receptor protein